jgi:hypothetical protein
MSDTDRNRAIRLLALALKARESRSEDFDRLTQLAMDAFTHAEDMELGSSQAADTSASGTSAQIYEG